MLWKKAPAAVGLVGLTPREAENGALTAPEFQDILDPFEQLIKEVKVDLINYCNIHCVFTVILKLKRLKCYCLK